MVVFSFDVVSSCDVIGKCFRNGSGLVSGCAPITTLQDGTRSCVLPGGGFRSPLLLFRAKFPETDAVFPSTFNAHCYGSRPFYHKLSYCIALALLSSRNIRGTTCRRGSTFTGCIPPVPRRNGKLLINWFYTRLRIVEPRQSALIPRLDDSS